jgi:hypothetical protein
MEPRDQVSADTADLRGLIGLQGRCRPRSGRQRGMRARENDRPRGKGTEPVILTRPRPSLRGFAAAPAHNGLSRALIA